MISTSTNKANVCIHLDLSNDADVRQKDVVLAGKVAEQILDNARISAGVLEDPRPMLKRLNKLLRHTMIIDEVL